MPPNVDKGSTCTICKKKDAQLCGRCKSSCYCSKECQANDWPNHKLLCKSFSEFDLSTRPSENHFRGIFFPEDQSKPQVVWLESPLHEVDGYKWTFPDLEPFLGPNTLPERVQVQTDAILQRSLTDTIVICCRSNFAGSQKNKSTSAVLAPKNLAASFAALPGQPFNWCGPIVIVGKKGKKYDMDSAACRDLDMSDFRYIADYLLSYTRLSPHV
ncbi:hypothetical protein PFICI_01831 [Pestalotiopsis fici W106-1]|uniref:MYND-type domain-containing protein n=1 Tax=Pestalotiopsis fici (strain W106-1 / CGMCC3.15140) TaxID=1229662 RepID=W3XPL8_PESFW|nr:uncharacterized protein PFICI_01831 [Pestalotiopsis fici W106-1]ETS88003.1 hypothetical protein PFICI_01831 [Pestalotiopsis fici W106-1]